MKGCLCAKVSSEVMMSFTGDVVGNYGLDGLPLHIFLWIAGRSGAREMR